MTSTVVGVFDEYEDAAAARDKLVDAGIDAQSMQMSSARGGEPIEDEPKVDRRGFFARLFGLGDDDDQAGHYAEAVRRGSTALTVSLDDDSRVDTVGDILNECGAIDVDERVEYWRAGGYSSFDPAAPVFGDDDIQRDREQYRLAQEDLKAGRGEMGGGVRVHRRMGELPLEGTLDAGSLDAPSAEPRDTMRSTDMERERAMAAGGSDRPGATASETMRNSARYSGPERRMRSDTSYSGPERRLS